MKQSQQIVILRAALLRLDAAYRADAVIGPNMPMIVSFETNSDAHRQAVDALRETA